MRTIAVTINANYEQSVDLYIAHNEWLDDTHTPYITQLYKLGKAIDGLTTPRGLVGLSTEFRQTMSALNALAPSKEETDKKSSDDEFFASMGL